MLSAAAQHKLHGAAAQLRGSAQRQHEQPQTQACRGTHVKVTPKKGDEKTAVRIEGKSA